MNGYIEDILNKYANIGIDENLYKLEELINYKLEKFYFDYSHYISILNKDSK